MATPVDLTAHVPTLSLAERDRRWDAVRAAMADEELDALIVLGNDGFFGMGLANLRYLTQFGSAFGGCALFVGDEEPIVWNGALSQMFQPANAFLSTQHWVSDIRRSLGLSGLVDAIKERGLAAGRLGLAAHSTRFFPMPLIAASEYATLEHGLPDATLVPFGPRLEELRLVKSDEEIGLIRKAAEIAQAGVDALFEALLAGTTEAGAWAAMQHAQVVAGAEPNLFNLLSSGPVEHDSDALWHLLHGSEVTAAPTMRPIVDGDVVMMELHTSYGGYLAGTERTVYLGSDPPEPLTRLHDAALELQDLAEELLVPGAGVIDAWRAMVARSEALGVDFVELGFHGHGLASPEFPAMAHRPDREPLAQMVIDLTGETTLEEGMVLCTNIDLHDPSWKPDVGVMHGETLVVRPGRAERLAPRPDHPLCAA